MDTLYTVSFCASEDIKDYFAKYGTVLECNLKIDPATGRSRGFAFVLFDNASSVDKVRCNFAWKSELYFSYIFYVSLFISFVVIWP